MTEPYEITDPSDHVRQQLKEPSSRRIRFAVPGALAGGIALLVGVAAIAIHVVPKDPLSSSAHQQTTLAQTPQSTNQGDIADKACDSAKQPPPAPKSGKMPDVSGYIRCLMTHQVAVPRIAHPVTRIEILGNDQRGEYIGHCRVIPGGLLTEITPNGTPYILVIYTTPPSGITEPNACPDRTVGFVEGSVFSH